MVEHALDGVAKNYPLLHDNYTLDNTAQTWLSIAFMPVGNKRATAGSFGDDEASGMLQITIHTLQGAGTAESLDLASDIVAEFEAGQTLTHDKTVVMLDGAVVNTSAFTENSNAYITPITIDWRARRQRTS